MKKAKEISYKHTNPNRPHRKITKFGKYKTPAELKEAKEIALQAYKKRVGQA